MVNASNRDVVARLVRLGLVKALKDCTGYEVVSKSFRNHILTQLDKTELSKLHTGATEKGGFSKFELPLLIIVIAIGIFLYTTQKEAFSDLIKYMGGATVGIGSLLKFLGMNKSTR